MQPPIPIGVNKYRFQHPMLFQRGAELTTRLKYTNHLGQLIDTGIDLTNDGMSDRHRFGPTGDLVCGIDLWPWANVGGDYIDANGTQQGSTPFSTLSIPPASLPNAPSQHNINVTTLLQTAYTQSRWLAVFLKIASGNANVYIELVGSLETTTQRIDVTYTDGSTEVLNAWVVASILPGNARTNAMDPTVRFQQNQSVVIEFFQPVDKNKTIASATLRLYVALGLAYGNTTVLATYLVSPPIPNMTRIPGAAADHPLDANITTMTGYVTHMDMVTDTTVIDDVLDTLRSGDGYSIPYIPGNPAVNAQNTEINFDPELWTTEANKASIGLTTWPTPAERAQLLPHREPRKFVGRTMPEKFRIVHSDDAEAISKGFLPLAPGLGAVQIKMVGDGIESGQIWANGQTQSVQDVRMAFPKEKIGRVGDLYIRFYVRLGDGFRPNAKQHNTFCMLGSTADKGKYPDEVGLTWNISNLQRIDHTGKWTMGAGQQTRQTIWKHYVDPTRVAGDDVSYLLVDGGNGQTAGVAGHSARLWFRDGIMDPTIPGPARGGMTPQFGPLDYDSIYHSLQEERAKMNSWGNGWQMAPTRYGGLGHLFPDHWYCFEWRFKANTVLPYELPPVGTHYSRSGYLIDGKTEFWIDGVKAGMSPDWAFRSGLMIDWAMQLAQSRPFGAGSGIRPMTNVPLDQYMGAAQLMIDTYYGGKTPCPEDRYWWINGLVVAENYIGPMAGVSTQNGGIPITTPPSSLPSYVAAAGDVAVLSTSGGQISNTLASVTPVYHLGMSTVKITTDYCGGVANPYFGQYGATVYDGPGHSASNDTGMYMLVYGATQATWRRVIDGTPIYGSTSAEAFENSTSKVGAAAAFSANDWMEYSDGKPASRHTYGEQTIVGPANGGAAHGTFYRLVATALGHVGSNPMPPQTSCIPHKVDFPAATGTYAWARAGTRGPAINPLSPQWSAHVPAQNRIYIHMSSLNVVMWFDLTAGQYVSGTGTALSGAGQDVAPGNQIDGYIMAAVPERDLVLFADSVGGSLRIRYMQVGAGNTNPSWVNTGVTLSQAVPASSSLASMAWVPGINKLIIGSPLDTAAVYEIDIPTTLSSTWTVTRAPLPGGKTIPFYNAVAGSGTSSTRNYKAWSWLPGIKSLMYCAGADPNGVSDTVYLYRPRGT